jgi:hypothetical protein
MVALQIKNERSFHRQRQTELEYKISLYTTQSHDFDDAGTGGAHFYPICGV